MEFNEKYSRFIIFLMRQLLYDSIESGKKKGKLLFTGLEVINCFFLYELRTNIQVNCTITALSFKAHLYILICANGDQVTILILILQA